jgi:hypothetical protein
MGLPTRREWTIETPPPGAPVWWPYPAPARPEPAPAREPEPAQEPGEVPA